MPSNNTTTTTTASLSSQGHNNPWENAANDSAFFTRQEQHEEQLLLTTTTNNNTNTIEVIDESSLPSALRNNRMSFGTKLLLSIHVGDVICGLGLMLYSYLTFQQQQQQQQHHDVFMAVCAYVLASVWTSRGVLVVVPCLLASGSSASSGCSLRWSGTLSLVLMILYVSVSALAAMDPQLIYHRVPDLPASIRSYMWSLWLLVAVWECCRWALLSKRQDHQEQDEVNHPQQQRDQSYDYSASSGRRRPWWWNGTANNNHNQFQRESLDTPLISEGGNNNHAWTSSNSRNFSMDHGMSTTKRRWWPFRYSSSHQDDDNGSVDEYASINEDWASKSEEDPFWWTKEQDGNGGTGGKGAPIDTSWAKDGGNSHNVV